MEQEENLFKLQSTKKETLLPNVPGDGADDSNDGPPTSNSDASGPGVSQRNSAINIRSARGQSLSAGAAVFSPEDQESEDSKTLDGPTATTPLQLGLRRFGWFAICLLLIVVSGSTLLALTQSAILLREIGAWIPVARYAGYVSLFVLWIGLVVASAQLFVVFWKLRTSPSFSTSSLLDLHSRGENRLKATQNQKLAVNTLREFLDHYPQDDIHLHLLGRAGFNSDGISTNELYRRRKELLQQHSGVSQQWLKRVRVQFFQPLDEAAGKLISAYAYKIALGTAVSPRGATDSLIMLAGLFKLTEDLCRLYAVRPSWFGTIMILAQVLAAGIAASSVDEASDKLHEEISSSVSSLLGGFTAEVVSQVGARSAEGTVNWLFVRRIGERVKYYLQPLRD